MSKTVYILEKYHNNERWFIEVFESREKLMEYINTKPNNLFINGADYTDTRIKEVEVYE